MQTLWTFHTRRFKVTLACEPDQDADLSWRDQEQADYDEAHGVEYWLFRVAVYLDGYEIAADYLGGSGYSDPNAFGREHRDPDPMNRNCSIMRAVHGQDVSICHYFPDMVRNAISEARICLENPPRLRRAAWRASPARRGPTRSRRPRAALHDKERDRR